MIKKLIVIGLAVMIAGASYAVKIRVATWNMEVGISSTNEFNCATSILARVGADIVGMNELTTTSYDAFIALAAAMNYPYTAFSYEYNDLTGPSRLGFMSRFPIKSAVPIPPYPGAVEVPRPPLRCVFDVPGALNDFVAYEVHCKASQTDPDEFMRAIEARRTRSNIVEYITSHPLDSEFVVMGDMNDDIDEFPGQAVSYSSIPAGISSSFVLGSDVTFPQYYRIFPNDRFSEDIDFMTLHPYREDSTEDGTSWESNIRWDYMIFSRDVMESPYGAPVGEIYHSAYDDGVGGLPKYGAALNSWIITNGPNHCLVFADINLMDLLPCLNPVLMISEVVDHNSNTNADYVELYNSGTTALSVSNYQLVVYVDGLTPLSIPLKGSIAAGGKYVIAANSNIFVSTYSKSPTLANAYVNRLSGNDVVVIKNPNNALSDVFGVLGEPASSTDYSMTWAYRSNRAERVLGYSDPSPEFITNEWTISSSAGATPGDHSACDQASVYYADFEMYPAAPKTGQNFAVTADIQPNLPASNLSATLYYRLNSGSWSNAGMSNASGTI